MPRSSSSSSRSSTSTSSSNKSLSRSASTHAPPATQKKTQQQQQTQQPAKSSMMGGIMGAVASGLAFGAGMELMRGMFNGNKEGETSIPPFIFPALVSGLCAYGSNKLVFAGMKRKGLYTALVFGGVFALTYGALGEKPEGAEGSQGAQH